MRLVLALINFLARFEFADADVFPADFVRAGGRGNAVNLEADEATGVEVVVKVGAGDAVDPGADVITLRDDAVVIPFVIFEGVGRFGLVGKIVEPLVRRASSQKLPQAPLSAAALSH